MRVYDMSLEELEEQDRQLHLLTDEIAESRLYQQKIELYKAMYHKVRKMVLKKQEDRTYLDAIKERLVFNLVHYGTYLKMADQKVEEIAVPSLEEALNYDPHNPIAAYRLGFLYYKSSDFINSVKYFQKAITSELFNKNNKMALTDRQKMNAQLYLTNSALQIAKESQENLAKFSLEQVEQLPGYEFSTLFDSIGVTDTYLRNHAFYKETRLGKTTCSKQHCDEIAMDSPRDTIVLYFGDIETSLNYNGRAITLSKRLSDVLKFLLKSSSSSAPANVNDVKECFGDLNLDEEVQWPSYRQTVSRLRQAIKNCGIPDIIETSTETKAYYFNGSASYMILYRVDNETE